MATRAMIGELTSEGYVRAVYSHWDGYPEGVGQTLLDHYTTSAQVNKLIGGGDLSSLGDSPTETEYYRDRGDTNVEPEIYYLEDYADHQEFNYVWTGRMWLVGVRNARGNWYKLSYYLRASIEDIHEFVAEAV